MMFDDCLDCDLVYHRAVKLLFRVSVRAKSKSYDGVPGKMAWCCAVYIIPRDLQCDRASVVIPQGFW